MNGTLSVAADRHDSLWINDQLRPMEPSPFAHCKVCQHLADRLGTSKDREAVMNSSWEAECIRDLGLELVSLGTQGG